MSSTHANSFIVIYFKNYTGTPEVNPHKHTISKEQVDSLISMLNCDNIKDVELARKIIINSNVDENYAYIISRLYKWRFRISKDKMNRSIERVFP